MTYQTLKVQQDVRGVLTIYLNRPDLRNAFNDEMISDLTRVFGEDVLRSEVRVVVLRGEGPTFCAGGDLNWMKKAVDFTYAENLRDTQKLSALFALMNECPKPLIGVIHGAAIGGGVGLVSVCDLVIAASETQLSLSEVRLGIVPACIGPFVIAKIGPSHARRYFLSAERFSAMKAQEIGLVHEVVSTEVDLQKSLDSYLVQILQCSPNALKVAKQLILDLSWPEKRNQLQDYLGYISKTLSDLRVSPEGQEGVRAFLEKRKPAW
jgi:methylglutaconyl-CoA hydratase